MRIVVVGNGLAGTIFSKTARELDQNCEIDIFTDEKYLYYPRPNLIDFLAGNLPFERMFAFPENWYRDQNINIYLEKPVQKVFPDSHEIEVNRGKREKYETLVLANGSCAFVPPFREADKKGVFTLRTLDDAQGILEYIKDHRKVAIIGGGVLGLEIARAIKNRGADVEVIEFFPYLLSRQLDPQGGEILKREMEKMGIEVHLGLATEEIIGAKEIKGLRFKGGKEFKVSMAVVAAGVRPNIKMPLEAGIETDKGIVVNEFLQTSKSKIFAAGDNVQFQGKLWGIIPAAFEQAKAAAYNVFGKERKYEATIPSNTLKVAGLHVTSIGTVNPEKGTCEEFRKAEKEKGRYKKIAVQEGKVIGAIWMGTKKGADEINRIISQKKNVGKWKESLLEDNFDFSVL